MLLRSRRACAFLFGDRVVTLTNREGVVSPSSIVVDVEEIPDVDSATIADGIFDAGRFTVALCEAMDLSLEPCGELDVRSCLGILAPFIVEKRMGISTSLLMHLGRAEAPGGIEGRMARKQASLFDGSPGLSELARGLLGLGYGLTPSGDDFIVGMVLAHEVAGSSAREIRSIVEAYDSPFSRTILLDALDGHYALPVKKLGDAMLGNGDLLSAASLLTHFGHSSGSDILSGVWFTLSDLEK